MHDLSVALTELDETPDLWTGVLTFKGKHTTAGLDMPKFFGPDAEARTEPALLNDLAVLLQAVGHAAVGRDAGRRPEIRAGLDRSVRFDLNGFVGV